MQTWNSQADTLDFAYDLVDRRVSMTDVTGTTTYTYDDLDRLIDLTDSAGRAFGFAYDPLDRLTRKTMANGTATDFTYDAASQLLNIITEKISSAEVIESIAYAYNTTGTRASETRLDGNTRTFFYDANDRVTQVINSQLPAQNELFSYDLMGNWTTDSRQHNGENELTQDSGYTYSYDELGNLTERQSLSDPADRTTYTWDARNLLIAVDGPVNDTSYAYDARNRRVAKTVDGVTTQYFHDGLNILLEYDGAGNLLARNTHAGLDQLCVRDEVTASTPYYVCQDGISSVLSVSDDSGNILQRYRYSAFGEQQVLDANFNLTTDSPLIPFAYTGREWEPGVGMYFYRARFYDAELGRFISRDPLGLGAGDVNLYAYVFNNPISYWDPLGLLSEEARELGRLYGNGKGGHVDPNAAKNLSRGSSKALTELETTAKNAVEKAKRKLADPDFKGNRKAQLNSIKLQTNRLKALRSAKNLKYLRFMRRGGFLLLPLIIPGDTPTWESRDDDNDGYENGIDPYPNDFDNNPDNDNSDNFETPKDSEH